MRIVDLIERNAIVYRDESAVIVPGQSALTHGELRRRVTALAAGLHDLGVGRGDRVAVLAGNGLTVFDAYLAVAYLGASVVPLSTRLTDAELEFIVADAAPAAGMADGNHADALARVVGDIPLLIAGSPEYESLLDLDPPPAIAEHARQDDVAMLVYTSGTTGRPKGVCLTQAALTFNAVTIALAQGLRHEDVFLTTTPLYHVASGTRVMTMLLDGQAHVVMPAFDTEAFFQAVESYGVTTAVVVPTQLRRIIEHAKADDPRLRTLRLLVYGAAPTSLTVIRRALATLGCGFYQGYGLTEACTNLTGLLPGDHVDATDERLRSCGRPVPGVEIGIYDSAGERLPAGHAGEIRIRTDKLMTGYWRDPEATNEALAGGWLRTGDIGRVDDAGYLTIVGRASDMLISGGVNIYPSEIEAVLHLHPAVAEAAVVGHPDEEWGEVPVAFVITRPGARVSPDDIRQFCRERLAGLKVPRRVEFTDDLPRTATGKIRKLELRA